MSRSKLALVVAMLLSTMGFVCYPQACANAARFCAQRAESLDILIAPFRPWMRVARVRHMAAGTAANCTTCARSHLDQLFCCSPNCRSTDERFAAMNATFFCFSQRSQICLSRPG